MYDLIGTPDDVTTDFQIPSPADPSNLLIFQATPPGPLALKVPSVDYTLTNVVHVIFTTPPATGDVLKAYY
jgi:hypothetical protein